MEVLLSPEREHFVCRVVNEGRYSNPAAVVEAALRLLEARSQMCPLRSAVAIGLEQALAGRSTTITVDDVVCRAVRHRRRA